MVYIHLPILLDLPVLALVERQMRRWVPASVSVIRVVDIRCTYVLKMLKDLLSDLFDVFAGVCVFHIAYWHMYLAARGEVAFIRELWNFIVNLKA